jgi:DNA-3-methyladenine glycosylase II
MSSMRIETQEHIAGALRDLSAADPRLAEMLELTGEVPLRRRSPGFDGLAGIIVAQMVSRASADAIHARMVALTGPLTPASLLALGEEDFRAAGLSRAKQSTLVSLARACADGHIDLDGLCLMPADEAIAEMTALKGVGPWTAEVYLLFCAGHPDVFPAGDVALQSAAHHGLRLDARPGPVALRAMAEAWQPWRGVAARLLWAYYARIMRREAIPVQG